MINTDILQKRRSIKCSADKYFVLIEMTFSATQNKDFVDINVS